MEIEAEPRFLLHHSNNIINSEGVYATLSGMPFIRCTKIQNTGSSYLTAMVSTQVYKTRPLDFGTDIITYTASLLGNVLNIIHASTSCRELISLVGLAHMTRQDVIWTWLTRLS